MKFLLREVSRWTRMSRPPRGAWVEIIREEAHRYNREGRAPRGARGLKYRR